MEQTISAGFENVLSWAQHWRAVVRLIVGVERINLNIVWCVSIIHVWFVMQVDATYIGQNDNWIIASLQSCLKHDALWCQAKYNKCTCLEL
jgi:hypothetical protein